MRSSKPEPPLIRRFMAFRRMERENQDISGAARTGLVDRHRTAQHTSVMIQSHFSPRIIFLYIETARRFAIQYSNYQNF
jgi:hypothetical protein